MMRRRSRLGAPVVGSRGPVAPSSPARSPDAASCWGPEARSSGVERRRSRRRRRRPSGSAERIAERRAHVQVTVRRCCRRMGPSQHVRRGVRLMMSAPVFVGAVQPPKLPLQCSPPQRASRNAQATGVDVVLVGGRRGTVNTATRRTGARPAAPRRPVAPRVIVKQRHHLASLRQSGRVERYARCGGESTQTRSRTGVRPGRCRSRPAPRRESRSRSRALSRRPPRAFSPAPPRRGAAARSARAPGPGTRPPTRPPRP